MSLPAVSDLNRLSLYMRPSCPYCVRVADFCGQAEIGRFSLYVLVDEL